MPFDVIPIKLSEARQTEIIRWFGEELEECVAGRSEMEQNWADCESLYEGKTNPKSFPWPNASNVRVPITAITTDAIAARAINTFLGSRPIVTVRPKRPDAVDEAQALQEFLTTVSNDPGELDALNSWSDPILECLKKGTMVVKVPWVWDRTKVRQYDDLGRPTKVEKTRYEGPRFIHVPLEDFFIPWGYPDLQTAPWLAHRYYLNWNDIQERVYQGLLDKSVLEKLKGHERDEYRPVTEKREEMTGFARPLKSRLFTFYEVHAHYDIDGDGLPDDAIFTISLDPEIMGRAIFPFYFHNLRPFVSSAYMKREGWFYGKGIPQAVQHLQKEIDTIHNQRRDNATIANIPLFKGRRNMRQEIRPGRDIYPGGTLWLSDPEGFVPMELGRLHPETFQEEGLANAYIEKVSGVTDYTLGRESPVVGSRATASATLALIQEGNKRFDLSFRFMRAAISEAYTQAVQLYQQFMPAGKAYLLMGEKGEQVERLMRFPRDYVRQRLGFEVSTATSSTNEDVRRQAIVIVADRMQQFYQGIMQLAQVVANPQVPPPMKQLAIEMATSSSRLAEKFLEQYMMPDVENYIPGTLLKLVREEEEAHGGFGPGSETAGPGVSGGSPGLEALFGGVPPPAPGGAGGPPQAPGGVPGNVLPFPGAGGGPGGNVGIPGRTT